MDLRNGGSSNLVRVEAYDGKNYYKYSFNLNVSGIDAAKPVVSGVKNGKTYKKAVKVKFTDKLSGLKKATLNGKTIKSGKKGAYTLKVTDKAGNTTTVKFKIVKKK